MTSDRADRVHTQHGALMDRVYRRQRHFYDLTRKYYLVGRDRMLKDIALRPHARVLEIGCGTARNLIRLARMNPTTALYGLDASEAMLETAGSAIARAGLGHRIGLKHGFAEEVTPGLFGSEMGFDAAFFSYSLSMIPDWRAALAAAADAVRPGGAIHVVDFGDLNTMWAPLAQGLRGWLRLFHVSPRTELLAQLERVNRDGSALRTLPFRYAFVLKAGPDAIRSVARA